jgi:hypothetical protein
VALEPRRKIAGHVQHRGHRAHRGI